MQRVAQPGQVRSVVGVGDGDDRAVAVAAQRERAAGKSLRLEGIARRRRPRRRQRSHLTRLRDALHGPMALTAARSDVKDAIARVHEPAGMITQMALGRRVARRGAEPVPTTVYRVEVTLESGATLLVAEASDFEYAKEIGMRVIDEARRRNGRHRRCHDRRPPVVSVDVLGRNGA